MLKNRLFSNANDVPSRIQITVAGGLPITPLQAVTSCMFALIQPQALAQAIIRDDMLITLCSQLVELVYHGTAGPLAGPKSWALFSETPVAKILYLLDFTSFGIALPDSKENNRLHSSLIATCKLLLYDLLNEQDRPF